jgi:hypothetical protein
MTTKEMLFLSFQLQRVTRMDRAEEKRNFQKISLSVGSRFGVVVGILFYESISFYFLLLHWIKYFCEQKDLINVLIFIGTIQV